MILILDNSFHTMGKLFSSNDCFLSEILSQIEDDSIQLPDFQRSWVWTDSQIRNLIASLASSYPVGAVMFLTMDDKSTVKFKNRSFHPEKTTDKNPSQLVLDGQQRLTSVYRALYRQEPVETKTDNKSSTIRRYYYFDIQSATDGGDILNAIVYMPETKILTSDFGRKIELDLSTPEKEYEKMMFPLNIIFDSQKSVEWENEFREYHDYKKSELKLLDSFRLAFKTTIENYQIPVITLSSNTPKEAICKVFENVNTGGVPLTAFELLTAIYAADDYKLRDSWDNVKTELTKDGELLSVIDPIDYLTSVLLVSKYYKNKETGEAVSCKRKDLLSMPLEEYKKYSDKVKDAYVRCKAFLIENHIFSSNNLPYPTQLIPLAAVFAILGNRAEEAKVLAKIKRWYWCGVLGEMYGGANETRYANDVSDLTVWATEESDVLPDTVDRAYFSSNRLLTLATRNSAAYKGIMALILENNAEDLITATKMDIHVFLNNNVDIHHIFPQSYCIKQNYPKTKWNSIINKTPQSRRTNEVIGGKAPSVYLKTISKQIDDERLDTALSTNLIDVMSIKSDDFDSFIVKRAKSLLNLIDNAMGKKVSDRSNEDVIKAFGVSLEDVDSTDNEADAGN